MPWTPSEFKQRHAKNLTDSQASRASKIANAMLRRGVDEGVCIATGIKRAKELACYPGTLPSGSQNTPPEAREQDGNDNHKYQRFLSRRALDTEESGMGIEIANLQTMLAMEMEMAKSWAKMNPKERQVYIKAHPLSKFAPGGRNGKNNVANLKSHLLKHGFVHQGKGVWNHKNGRTLKVNSGGKNNTHKHHITITHKNGDVSARKTNSNKRAVGIITRMAKSGVSKRPKAAPMISKGKPPVRSQAPAAKAKRKAQAF